MKIVGFVGSPRKGGNTEVLVSEVLAGAAEKGAETKIFNLTRHNIKGCQACHFCVANKKCAQKDDMQKLYEEVQEADAVILGSPVYMWQVSSQTKCFIDRMLALLNPDFTTRLKGNKKLLLVFAQGNPDTAIFKDYFENTSLMLEFLGFQVKGAVIAGGTNEPGDVVKQKDVMESARQKGKELASHLL